MKHLSLILITLSLISCGLAKDKTWTKHQIYRGSSRQCNGLDPADFNRDGFLDYATNFEDIVTQTNDRILFFRNQGGNPVKFERVDIPKPDYADWRSRPIEVADLNDDGKKEIVVGLIHHDGLFPKDKAAILIFDYSDDPKDPKDWNPHVIKWSDGFRGKKAMDGEKWDNFFFDDVDRDGDLDIVANCEEYKLMGVEWFENPGDRKNTQAQVDAVNMERVAVIPLTGGKAGQLNHMAVNDEQKHLFVAKKN